MIPKKQKTKINKPKDSFEVFIKADGTLLLNNFSRDTYSVLREVSKEVKKTDIYCG